MSLRRDPCHTPLSGSKIGTPEADSGAGQILPSTRHRMPQSYCTTGVDSIIVNPHAVHCFREETVSWNPLPVSSIAPVAARWWCFVVTVTLAISTVLTVAQRRNAANLYAKPADVTKALLKASVTPPAGRHNSGHVPARPLPNPRPLKK